MIKFLFGALIELKKNFLLKKFTNFQQNSLCHQEIEELKWKYNAEIDQLQQIK